MADPGKSCVAGGPSGSLSRWPLPSWRRRLPFCRGQAYDTGLYVRLRRFHEQADVTDRVGRRNAYTAETVSTMNSSATRITIPEIATRLQVGRIAVYQMLERRVIPGIRVGRRWIVTPIHTNNGKELVGRHRFLNLGPQKHGHNRIYLVDFPNVGNKRNAQLLKITSIEVRCRPPARKLAFTPHSQWRNRPLSPFSLGSTDRSASSTLELVGTGHHFECVYD